MVLGSRFQFFPATSCFCHLCFHVSALGVSRLFPFPLANVLDSPARRLYMFSSCFTGVLLITLFVCVSVKRWIRVAFRVSPLLAVNVVIFSTLFLLYIWKRYKSEICITIFRAAMTSMHWLRHVRDKYLMSTSAAETEVEPEKRRNRKLIRAAIVLLMVQHCIASLNHFISLHSVLAYIFTLDVFSFVTDQFHDPTVLLLLDEDARQQPNGQTLNRREMLVMLGVQLFKCSIIATVVYHQLFCVRVQYFLITAFYFLLTSTFLEHTLTACLESAELDLFEGLEEYYVKCILGFLDITFALIFMVWTLLRRTQILMFIALYTNVYSGGRELLATSVITAYSEWSVLAHFRRATRDELSNLDDVCAICLHPMATARRTPCRHFFHGRCLRRCLKQKSACPLCNKHMGLY